ncbi:MAG: hypothetical protein R3313_04315 [Candidatus Saccharimonadales bacterium]|nr:hypothetical protein [Candidatus Saccharimonadales bacterium]
MVETFNNAIYESTFVQQEAVPEVLFATPFLLGLGGPATEKTVQVFPAGLEWTQTSVETDYIVETADSLVDGYEFGAYDTATALALQTVYAE